MRGPGAGVRTFSDFLSVWKWRRYWRRVGSRLDVKSEVEVEVEEKIETEVRWRAKWKCMWIVRVKCRSVSRGESITNVGAQVVMGVAEVLRA